LLLLPGVPGHRGEVLKGPFDVAVAMFLVTTVYNRVFARDRQSTAAGFACGSAEVA
jgi:hypothetical protein